MTPEDREAIIKDSVERTLLLLPAFIFDMVKRAKQMSDISADFYKKYPQYTDNKEMVAEAFEKLQREKPGVSIEEIIANLPRAVQDLDSTMIRTLSSTVKSPLRRVIRK